MNPMGNRGWMEFAAAGKSFFVTATEYLRLEMKKPRLAPETIEMLKRIKHVRRPPEECNSISKYYAKGEETILAIEAWIEAGSPDLPKGE